MKKIVVAMSGGIDSSVSAALLKRANFDVVGVFMKLADLPRFKEGEKRARKIAEILKIPFLVLDLRTKFKKRIVDWFFKEYKIGLTPNPCVVCNKEIKFGFLLEKALSLDADFVATGHYARLRREIRNPKSEIRKLIRAKDKNKDQSYFLWMLNQEQLKRIMFPIGNYTRKEVENLAKKFKLPVLGIKKSVEICFIKTTINDFLKGHLKKRPGKIVTKDGKIVGEHEGLWLYTIGQRKGLGLAGGPAFAKASAGKPYYILDKDLKKNLLIVTKDEKDLYKRELICKNINWISDKKPRLPLKIKAKIRYRHQPASATLTHHLKPNTYHLVFKRPQRAITPGQSVVFYLPTEALAKAGKGEEVLGGGIIT